MCFGRAFLARLEEVQEELLYYPGVGVGVSISKKFIVKVFYVMGKALSGKLSCPCDRSCLGSYQEQGGGALCYKAKVLENWSPQVKINHPPIF